MSSRGIQELVQRLVAPEFRESEADIQASIRDLLLQGHFDLGNDHVKLGTNAGECFIDISVGATIIEVKKTIATPGAKRRALEQLEGYVRTKSEELNSRVVGVLSDGIRWSAWHSVDMSTGLAPISDFELAGAIDDTNFRGLLDWLDDVVATRQDIAPTPKEVERLLGAESASTRADLAALGALFDKGQGDTSVRLKKRLWKELLSIASGTSVDIEDDSALFVEHTYLVLLADLIGHAVLGLDPVSQSPYDLLRGSLFAQAQVFGVVEQDFFDWVGDVDGGFEWIHVLAKRVSRFDWSNVEHDVLKVLYESVIGAETRYNLGEYYTPDWLCKLVVDKVIENPATDRVLDPACGSGTFLFWAVRHALESMELEGIPTSEAVERVTHQVFGIDVHPVAVSLAKITYLLAIGRERLHHRGEITIPVYVGDSVQFRDSDASVFGGDDALVVHIAVSEDSLDRKTLRFPESIVDDLQVFYRLISDLVDLACDREPGSDVADPKMLLDRYALEGIAREMVRETYEELASLNDDGRNHIWAYYVRNLSRPRWLSRESRRVDCIVGNPPWLPYRKMTSEMSLQFRNLSSERGLWSGGNVATQQDLSALFVARSSELYLKNGGRFGMVLPFAVLSRAQYRGFRTGDWSTPSSQLTVKFEEPWDLSRVEPDIFPVPSCVVFGQRVAARDDSVATGIETLALPRKTVQFQGRQPEHGEHPEFVLVRDQEVRAPGDQDAASEYRDRFYNGANLYPHVLVLVEKLNPGPLGISSGMVRVESKRSTKGRWRDISPVTDVVEDRFVRRIHRGQTLVPFRLLEAELAVIPWADGWIPSPSVALKSGFQGLASWYSQVSSLWEANRGDTAADLIPYMNHQNKLERQLERAISQRVVYNASGSRLCAARLTDASSVVDNKLVWSEPASEAEALYLVGLLNSDALTRRVAPYQSQGAFGARDFTMYVWQVAVPVFDPSDPLHVAVAERALICEGAAAEIDVSFVSYPRNRGKMREILDESGLMDRLEEACENLLVAISS